MDDINYRALAERRKEDNDGLIVQIKELERANALLSSRYESLRADVIVPGIKANDAAKANIRALEAIICSLRKALEEAASLRESDLDDADDYVKHWRSLILIANRA